MTKSYGTKYQIHRYTAETHNRKSWAKIQNNVTLSLILFILQLVTVSGKTSFLKNNKTEIDYAFAGITTEYCIESDT